VRAQHLRAHTFAAATANRTASSANDTESVVAASLHKRWRRQAADTPITSTGQPDGLQRTVKTLPTLESLTSSHANVFKASPYF
jgi:hypothetical protein